MKRDFILYSGSANRSLALDVARLLKFQLSRIEIVTFADSEKRVRIEENVSERMVFVIASLSNPVDSHLVELCLIGDALKHNAAGKLVAVIPYYGYSRQDKAHRKGEGVSARVMARLIEATQFDQVIAIDLHSELVAGYFTVNVVHLFGASIFVPYMKNLGKELIVVAPDAGGTKRAQLFARLISTQLSLIKKQRRLDKIHTIESVQLIGETRGKTAILVDDIITSGSTLVKSAYLLKEHGAKKVIACVTHADFIEGTRKVLIESPIDRIYVSDSIHLPEESKFSKLEVISMAPLLAEQINKITR